GWYRRTTSAGVPTPYFFWFAALVSSADLPQTSATNSCPIFCSRLMPRSACRAQPTACGSAPGMFGVAPAGSAALTPVTVSSPATVAASTWFLRVTSKPPSVAAVAVERFPPEPTGIGKLLTDRDRGQ